MAGRKKGAPSQSEFIREKLTANPKLNLAGINDVWKAEQKSGEITATLFYQVKSKLGFARKRAGRPRKNTERRGMPVVINGHQLRPIKRFDQTPNKIGYASIENQLDELVTLSTLLGDHDLAESLRKSRRLASAKIAV
ncbi:hypothetical protein K2Y11_15045 [bacterium]|nr:hypothetical protein [bacterium]